MPSISFRTNQFTNLCTIKETMFKSQNNIPTKLSLIFVLFFVILQKQDDIFRLSINLSILSLQEWACMFNWTDGIHRWQSIPVCMCSVFSALYSICFLLSKSAYRWQGRWTVLCEKIELTEKWRINKLKKKIKDIFCAIVNNSSDAALLSHFGTWSLFIDLFTITLYALIIHLFKILLAICIHIHP